MFQLYEKEFGVNRDFFLDSAPKVIWNEKGYFNILDGHHRVMYLFYKGVWDIPVKICEKDKVYVEMLEKIPNTFFSESIHLVYTENAYFWRKKNFIISSLLMKKDLLNKSVYINLDDAGYLARYCCRLGCKQCIDIEVGDKYIFAKQLCDIFQYNDCLRICQNAEKDRKLDIAVIDEECINCFEEVQALRYIVKLEKNGNFHKKLVHKEIGYEHIGEAFDGEKEYLFFNIKGIERQKLFCSK